MNIEKDLQEVLDMVVSNLKLNSVKDKIYIAGGCIRDMFNGVIPKDYDFYFTDNASAAFAKGVVSKQLLLNNNGNLDCWVLGKRINMIFTPEFNLPPEQLIEEFNFRQNMNFYFNGKLRRAVEVFNKELVVNRNGKYPLGTLMKIPRMQELGYTVSEADMAYLLGKVLPLNIKTQEEFVKACPNISGGLVIYASKLPTAEEYFAQTDLGQALS